MLVLAIPLLEFTPLPPRFLLVIIGMVPLYGASAGLVKRWFYAWKGPRRQAPVAATAGTQVAPSHATHSCAYRLARRLAMYGRGPCAGPSGAEVHLSVQCGVAPEDEVVLELLGD